MRKRVRAALVASALLTASGSAIAGLVSYTDLLARPHAAPDAKLTYGSGAQQFVELWLPRTAGPHPVIVLIHGGCWLADLPGLELMDPMADALRADGYAVWNIEYRRLGSQGGGYPATFLDASAAADLLRTNAAHYNLDLSRVIAVGHSAGGHLAMWLAARGHLPAHSPLRSARPLAITAVVSLAGILDLKGYREDGAACGGAPTVDGIAGAAARQGQDVYADTSPQALLPIGVPQIVVSGGQDHIVPEHWRASYVAAALAAGDKPQSLGIAAAGHFELIDPKSPAWPQIEAAIARLAK
ncbi:MAG TPA: alpha/beta hydrolase [Rhizomicrobium sp.]|nr:alpha/beta hydrolase [Rhizomicrobium sp.]